MPRLRYRDSVDEHLPLSDPRLDHRARDAGPGDERRGLVEAHAALLFGEGRRGGSRFDAVAVVDFIAAGRRIGRARALGDSTSVVALSAVRSAGRRQRSLQDRLEAAQGQLVASPARKRLRRQKRKSQCPSRCGDGIGVCSSPLQRAAASGDPRREAHDAGIHWTSSERKSEAKRACELAPPPTIFFSSSVASFVFFSSVFL